MPAGLWEKIMPVMQLTRPRMVQLLNILQLPTPLLDLADRYRLPERVLREVLSLPRRAVGSHDPHQHSEQPDLGRNRRCAADAIIARSAEVRKPPAPRLEPGRVAGSSLRRFAHTFRSWMNSPSPRPWMKSPIPWWSKARPKVSSICSPSWLI